MRILYSTKPAGILLLLLCGAFAVSAGTARTRLAISLRLQTVDTIRQAAKINRSGTDRLKRQRARAKQEINRLKDPALNAVPIERLIGAKKVKDQLLESRTNRVRALNAQNLAAQPASVSTIQWTERGPDNVGGRVRALLFDLNDAANGYKKVFAGGVDGGLWHTDNITANPVAWTKIDDFFANLAISCIAQNPANPQEIYVGTGEGWYNIDGVRGLGIWKSADGGLTWAQLSSTSAFYYVNAILVDKNGSVYAATVGKGIEKSSNGGATWSKVISSPLDGADLQLAANGDVYASTGDFSTGKIFISDFAVNGASTGNTGTWKNITPDTAGVVTPATTNWWRIKLACAPNNSNITYALLEGQNSYGLSSVQQYNKATNTWAVKKVPPGSSFSNGQAWYSIATAVDPNNSNILYAGSLDAVKTTDGGSTWKRITQWYVGEISGLGAAQYVHADHQAYAFSPGSSARLVMGTDGGISVTLNANASGSTRAAFTTQNNGFNVTQFYSAALHPTSYDYALAGAQDNGTQKFTSAGLNATTEATGGDGGFAFIDQLNGNVQIASYTNVNYFLSTDNGATFHNLVADDNDGAFINPTDYDSKQKNLYAAYQPGQYFRWNNVTAAGTPSTSPVTISAFAGANVTAVTVSPVTANRVYFGLDNGTVVRVDNAHAGVSAAGVILHPNPSSFASVSCVAIDPASEGHILVSYFNYGVVSIFETKNGTAATPTWTAVEGNLPDMPVRWCMFYPDDPTRAIIATELGVWTTDLLNGASTSWNPSNSGLANVEVDMLKYRPADRTLAAATHGRGLFTTILPYAAPPVLSYSSPQTYLPGVQITPLAPASTAVAPAAYSGTPVNIGSGFNGPFGVALDAAGNAYVADYNNNLVKKIPAGGGAPVSLGYTFSAPWGVAVDAAGNIYVAETNNGIIAKAPAGGGAPVVFASGFVVPTGVAVDAAGNVYVSDIGNNLVKEIPAEGGAPMTLGSGFNGPYGIAVDAAGNVFVADGKNNAVKEIPVAGGSPVTLGSGFSSPYGVAVDPAGNVFVADFDNNAVKEIPVGGGAPLTLGSSFGQTADIAVDGAGNVYVTDQTNNVVDKIKPVGGYYLSKALPAGLSFSNGTGIISGTPAGESPATSYTVTAYNPSGSGTASLNITVKLPPQVTLSYTSPHTYGTGSAVKLSPASSGVAAASYSNSAAVFASGLGSPTGVAIDASGNIFVTDRTNGVIKKFPVGGGAPVQVGPSFNSPWGVAVDGAGNVYVAENGTGNVYKIPTGGGAPVVLGAFDYPAGLAADAAGNVYVADASDNVVKKIPAGGGTAVQVGSGFSAPFDVALDAAGNLYIADYGNNAIKKIAAGTNTAVTLATGFNQPEGVAVDASGNIFVADTKNGLVKEILAVDGATVSFGYSFGVPTILKADAAGNVIVTDGGDNTVRKVRPAGGYYLDHALPRGLSFANATGIISGAATAPAAAANYTITAYNAVYSNTAVVNIRIIVNANLAALKLSSAGLSPAFSAGTASYTATVTTSTSSITVTPTAADPAATVKVNGAAVTSGTASTGIPLAYGPNNISIVVTAQGGKTTKTYTVTVTRPVSTNADLSNLKINTSGVTMSPAFSSSTTSYTASVPNATTSVKILASVHGPGSTFTINGMPGTSGASSAPINLNVGDNAISTVVTAQNGTTTKTYTITVNRAASGSNTPVQQLSVEKQQPASDGVTIHQGVSPNGDGQNDVLIVDGIANYPDNKLQIVNRSGVLVFEAKSYGSAGKLFDGHSNKTGAKQLPGTYFYSLDYTVKGVLKHKTGFIVLRY